MVKTEQQLLQQKLLTPGFGMNVHEYRILCKALEEKPKQIKTYADSVITKTQTKIK